jgi:hypothetical protein
MKNFQATVACVWVILESEESKDEGRKDDLLLHSSEYKTSRWVDIKLQYSTQLLAMSRDVDAVVRPLASLACLGVLLITERCRHIQ